MTTTLNSTGTVHLGSIEQGVDFDSPVLAAKAALDMFPVDSISFDFNQVKVTVGRFDSMSELFDIYEADRKRASAVVLPASGIEMPPYLRF